MVRYEKRASAFYSIGAEPIEAPHDLPRNHLRAFCELRVAPVLRGSAKPCPQQSIRWSGEQKFVHGTGAINEKLNLIPRAASGALL
jgi:hypothetical protein